MPAASRVVLSSGGRRASRGQSLAMAAIPVAVAIGLLGSATGVAQPPGGRVGEFKRSAEAAAAEAEELAARQPRVISESLVMNTVRQYPKKPELDGYLDQRSAQARAWEAKAAAKGWQRGSGIRNPYTGATYDKYYDDKGNWKMSIIENDYRATEKLQADWNNYYRRARATLDGLRQEYDALVADVGLTAAQQTEMAGMLASATDRMGQFRSPPPELLPRPVEGDANSPFPTFKAFDAITGQLIEIGSTGNRRPVAGEPMAGSPAPAPPAPPNPPAAGGASLVGTSWRLEMKYKGAKPGNIAWQVDLGPGGQATGYMEERGNPFVQSGTWEERGGAVTVQLNKRGSRRGVVISARVDAAGRLEPIDYSIVR